MIAAVVLLTAAAIAFLWRMSRRSAEALRLYTRTQSLAHRLDASEWQAMAEGKVSDELMREVQEIRAAFGEIQGSLARLGREQHQAWHVWERFHEYTEAVDRQYAALLRGDLNQARKTDNEETDPAFARLDRAINMALAASEDRARRLASVVNWGTVLILAGVGVIVAWMVEAIRRTQTLAERAKADARILEEARRAEAQIRELNEELETRVHERTDALQKANLRLKEEIDERQRLEGMLQEVSEREMRRLGRDLHDGMGQMLTGLAMRCKAIENRLTELGLPEAQEAARLSDLAGKAVDKSGDLAGMLYPVDLERHGLVPALQALAEGLRDQVGVTFEIRNNAMCAQYNTGRALHLYRITQEAVNNAIKHGHARTVRILLGRDDEEGWCALRIENDGDPYQDPKGPDGMGCRIMRYRAQVIQGTLDIRPGSNGGCVVLCRFRCT